MAELIEQTQDKLVIRKLIRASREEVFAAWIDPVSIQQWMCPGGALTAEATLDVRAGGSYRIVMKDPNEDFEHRGEYQVVEPPSKLSFTWTSKGTDLQPTLVTIELAAHGQQTELILTHERFPRAEPIQRHTAGWSKIADLLAEYFEKRPAKDDFQLMLRFGAPRQKLYQQFSTEQGVRNWWTSFCEMDARVDGQASFRFPKAGFYAIVKILRLERDRCVEWECVDSKHPEGTAYQDPRDWIGTKIRFEIEAIDDTHSQLKFTHAGLAPLECSGVCTNAWSFYLGQSLRRYLDTGTGQPSVSEA